MGASVGVALHTMQRCVIVIVIVIVFVVVLLLLLFLTVKWCGNFKLKNINQCKYICVCACVNMYGCVRVCMYVCVLVSIVSLSLRSSQACVLLLLFVFYYRSTLSGNAATGSDANVDADVDCVAQTRVVVAAAVGFIASCSWCCPLKYATQFYNWSRK